MQLRAYGFILVWSVLCVDIAACSKTDPASLHPSAAATESESASATSFEVVTVERPESVEAYHKMYRQGYDACALARKLRKMSPPPPMKQPPADYILTRKTYISDGKADFFSEEHFNYKMIIEEPSLTCETYLEHTFSTQLRRDGKSYNAYVDPHGKREGQPPEEWWPSSKPQRQVFTQPKMVKGFATKCMRPLLKMERLSYICAADSPSGLLTDLDGDAIVVASRVTSAEELLGPILTEPVSVKVGNKIDKALFDAAAAP